MGIFDKIVEKAKGEIIDIIEFLDNSNDTLVHKFERMGNEIKNGAQLIVRESQVAVLINEGKLADIYKPGRHELTTNNMPILTTLMGWKYGFNSPFKVDVYFISMKTFTGQKWGTKNPITMRDADFGVVRVRAFGSFGFRISDPEKIIKDFSGTSSSFEIDGLDEQLKSMILTEFTDALGELKIPVLDLAANYKELGGKIEEFLNNSFKEMGLEVKKFLIENISLPPEVEAAIDKRGQMNVLGNMDQFAKFQAANAMEEMAKNPGDGGGVMGAGMGMGMGMGMANMMNNAFSNNQQQSTTPIPPPVPGAISFFIAVNGAQQGPFNADQFKAGIANNQITKETLVWKEGMAAWAKAGDVPELAKLFGATPPPLPQT
ncbi:MAG: SPFH domain-containing protein [Leptospiraceae bacterium]|nr:SPFH domain-containing protein [Leptospiraceae bacterium]